MTDFSLLLFLKSKITVCDGQMKGWMIMAKIKIRIIFNDI